MKILKITFSILVVFLFSSCLSGIKKGADISRNHIDYIKSLGILPGDERIVLFVSQGRMKVSGNFFTDKRIAAYWIDGKHKENSFIKFAFYKEIDSIVPHLIKEANHSSYLEVYKNNGQKFKVYVDASSEETQYFFEKAIAEWKKNK
ncbi:hypothetical protein [Mucilaginibacter sp. OK098]|uniref:hypothetical protein n=1 Tax=Mucilaginibacter sp. OK098 TaxID=1855297 RepID=UPI00090F73C2|nr:hypothetical protein [Mucilaginibacter sp. OK098]SHM03565.1 hypothetical protein SAMN05216524_101595 [Mucilaginibacter sp. OK098]